MTISSQTQLNGTLRSSTVTLVTNVHTNSKSTDTSTEPINASESKLLEEMDKPYKCNICGESFKYEFTLQYTHMPKHKTTPSWENSEVLMPYAAGVKSLTLPKPMPQKPYGCPVCFKPFR